MRYHRLKQRIYICHTFYHVYIAHLKEFYMRELENNRMESEADVLLSTMSNDFGDLGKRMEMAGYFRKVLPFHEKEYSKYPELMKYKKDSGNLILNLIKRMIFTKKLGKKTEPLIPVDLKAYDDIYVFCDSDPIGYYLNYKKLPYHAVEDGLNCIKNYDTARFDNRGHFNLKAKMAEWNLIFIQNGYSKYCIDMEVNDTSVLTYPCKKYVESSRKILRERLKTKEKELLLQTFLEDYEGLKAQILRQEKGQKNILILTEPLCTLDVREQIFKDLIETYGKHATVFMKQHPRDLLDYEEKFSEVILLSKNFPMEMLNFLPNVSFDQVISVFTELGELQFGKEKIKLGKDFMDHYEEPLIHRQNEQIY
jgi:hypothetical protein